MKKSVLTLPLTLTALLTAALLSMVFLRAFLPQLIFPRLDIPTIVLLCLLALLAEHYLSPRAKHNYLLLSLLGALDFGLLTGAAGYVPWSHALLLGAAGALLLPLTTAVFTSIRRRLATGSAAPLAPLACALCLYLAFQAFRGVLL